jgi:hypothetical protein
MQQYEIKLNTTPIIDAVRAGRPCQERERWQKKPKEVLVPYRGNGEG